MPFAILAAEIVIIGQEVYYPKEDHRLGAMLTHYPVESGKSLSDNYVAQPDRITLEGWVSDVEPGVSQGDGAVVWNLLKASAGGPLLTVVTHIRTYRNMALIDVETVRDETTGGSLVFQVKLEEVLFSVSEVAEIAAAIVSPTGPAAARTAAIAGGSRVAPSISQPLFSLASSVGGGAFFRVPGGGVEEGL